MSESLKPIRINSATFEIRNVGRSPAWIKEIRFRMRCVTQLEPIPNYETSSIETAEEFILFQEVIAGGGGEKQFAILEEALSESDIQTRYEDGSKFIGLYGVIKYEDFLGAPHETGFCWTYATPRNLGALGFRNPTWGSIGVPATYRFRS
jgi:hypothetical protein